MKLSMVRLWKNFCQQNLKLRQKDKKIKLLNRHNDLEEEGDKEKMQWPYQQFSTSEASQSFSQQKLKLCQKDKKIKLLNRQRLSDKDMEDKERMQWPSQQFSTSEASLLQSFSRRDLERRQKEKTVEQTVSVRHSDKADKETREDAMTLQAAAAQIALLSP